MVVGAVGSFLANITPPLLEWARVDDAVGCVVLSYVMSNVMSRHDMTCHVMNKCQVGATCVHGVGGAWGMLAVGLFAQTDHITDVQFSRCSSNRQMFISLTDCCQL